jgi:hypothetical protein
MFQYARGADISRFTSDRGVAKEIMFCYGIWKAACRLHHLCVYKAPEGIPDGPRWCDMGTGTGNLELGALGPLGGPKSTDSEEVKVVDKYRTQCHTGSTVPRYRRG